MIPQCRIIRPNLVPNRDFDSTEAQFVETEPSSRPPASGRTVFGNPAAPVFLPSPGEDSEAAFHQILGLLDAPAHEHSEVAIRIPPGPCILGIHIPYAEHVNRDVRRILADELPLERGQEFPAVLVPPFFCLAGAPIGHREAVRRSCDRKFHDAGI